jgi:2-dehydropantoate 2-reductase
MKSNSILIVGTGALATLFAARLSAAGVSVTMLGSWPEGLAALRVKGARVVGEENAFMVKATHDPLECKGLRFALVLVKTWQTGHVAHQLQICLPGNGLALTLQNGLGNDMLLADHLGPQRVVQGVTTLGATLIEPGLVQLGGEGPISVESHPKLFPLIEMIQKAGFQINEVNNVSSLVWGKLVVSSVINPLTALLRIQNGELLQNSFSRDWMKELASETARVANALGEILPFQDPEEAAKEVAQQTEMNQSSMLQDVLRGAPTEIDAINGAIVRLAELNKLEAPFNKMIWSLVKAIPVRGKIKI